MKPVFFFALVLLLCSLSGCSPYEVQFEGPYDDSQNSGQIYLPYEIMTVENGNIHLYQRNLGSSKTLDNLPGGIEKASINYSHSRIAYKTPSQDIAIVDSTGASIGTVPNSAAAKWFDWHANDETLYILTGTSLSFWGPTLSVPITNLAGLFPAGSSEQTMPCAAVTSDGSIVVVLRCYVSVSSGYQSRVMVVPAAGTSVLSGVLTTSEEGQWLRMNANSSQVLFGTRYAFSSFNMRRVNLFNNTVQIFDSWHFAAPGPVQGQFAFLQNSKLVMRHSYLNQNNSFNTTVAGLTAVDW